MNDHFVCPGRADWFVEIEDGAATLYGPDNSFDSFFAAMLNTQIETLTGEAVLIPEDVGEWMESIFDEVEETCDEQNAEGE